MADFYFHFEQFSKLQSIKKEIRFQLMYNLLYYSLIPLSVLIDLSVTDLVVNEKENQYYFKYVNTISTKNQKRTKEEIYNIRHEDYQLLFEMLTEEDRVIPDPNMQVDYLFRSQKTPYRYSMNAVNKKLKYHALLAGIPGANQVTTGTLQKSRYAKMIELIDLSLNRQNKNFDIVFILPSKNIAYSKDLLKDLKLTTQDREISIIIQDLLKENSELIKQMQRNDFDSYCFEKLKIDVFYNLNGPVLKDYNAIFFYFESDRPNVLTNKNIKIYSSSKGNTLLFLVLNDIDLKDLPLTDEIRNILTVAEIDELSNRNQNNALVKRDNENFIEYGIILFLVKIYSINPDIHIDPSIKSMLV